MEHNTLERRGSPGVAAYCDGSDDYVGPVEIRPIAPGDEVGYVELLRQIDLETSFLAWEPDERRIDVDMMRTHLQCTDPSTSLHLLAFHDRRPVGFLVCHRPGNRRLRHRADFTMAVLHPWQGRGIGQRLLAALCRWAAANGITRLELTVMSHNQRAIALYRRVGFVPEGTKRGSIIVDDLPVDELLMAMDVSEK